MHASCMEYPVHSAVNFIHLHISYMCMHAHIYVLSCINACMLPYFKSAGLLRKMLQDIPYTYGMSHTRMGFPYAYGTKYAYEVEQLYMFVLYHRNYICAGVQAGCLPEIVKGPQGSKIQPVTGYRGSVEIIVNRGTCSVDYRGYV